MRVAVILAMLLCANLFSSFQIPVSSNPSALCDQGETYFNRGEYEKALPYFENAAAQNDPNAQYYLGDLYFHGYDAVAQDYKTARAWFLLAASQNHATAQLFWVSFLLRDRALSQTKKQLSNGTPSLLKMEIWMRNIIWHTAIRKAVVLKRIWIKLAQFILSWQIAVISWRKLHCQKWNFPSKQRMDCCFSENNGGIRD